MAIEASAKPARVPQALCLALMPTFSIAGWGALLPFVANIDTYALSFDTLECAAIYGAEFCVLAAIGVAIGLVVLLTKFAADLLIPRRSQLLICVLTTFLVLLFFAFGAIRLAFEWIGSFGADFRVKPSNLFAPAVAFAGAVAAAKFQMFRNIVTHIANGGRRVALGSALMAAPMLIAQPWHERASAQLLLDESVSRLRQQRPDIILITFDALSAGHMSLHGSPRPTTPNLEKLASEMTVFENAYAAANFTTPGANSILTGDYPSQHRALQLVSRPEQRSIQQSIPAKLAAVGYTNMYVSTNFHASPRRNGYARLFSAGFPDSINGTYGICSDRIVSLVPFLCSTQNPLIGRLNKAVVDTFQANNMYDPVVPLSNARKLVESRKGPFFLWVHVFPPHDPYAAPEPWLGRFDRSRDARTAKDSLPLYAFNEKLQTARRTRLLEARYQESIAWADFHVGAFLRDALRIRPNALVMISADHGESFSDGWGGHGGRMLNEDVIHIPLIVKFPAQSKGARVTVPVSQVDIKTIVDAVIQGRQENEVISELAAKRREAPVFAMYFNDNKRTARLTNGSIAAIDGRWKFVRHLGGFDTPKGVIQSELVDLLPVAASTPADRNAVRSRLARAIDAHLEQFGGQVR